MPPLHQSWFVVVIFVYVELEGRLQGFSSLFPWMLPPHSPACWCLFCFMDLAGHLCVFVFAFIQSLNIYLSWHSLHVCSAPISGQKDCHKGTKDGSLSVQTGYGYIKEHCGCMCSIRRTYCKLKSAAGGTLVLWVPSDPEFLFRIPIIQDIKGLS